MTAKHKISRSLLLLSTLLMTACGGGSSDEVKTDLQVIIDKIPDTQQVTPVVPSFAVRQVDIPVVENAVLRHVHRNSVSGNILPTGQYIDSQNGKVEQKNILGLYSSVEKNDNNSYEISLEDNGLAYFRVTNTKQNGKVRVHNFYGVPAGHYMTFDTTNVDDDALDNVQSQCRNVSIRITELPPKMDNSRLLINGRVITDVKYADNKAYKEQLTLCPIDDNQHYLAIVAFENTAHDISYGFNYYQQLQDNDLLELAIEHQAEMILWSADMPIDNEFQLSGLNSKWRVQVPLYVTPDSGGTNNSHQNGFLPKFTALDLDSYHFTSDVTELSSGVSIYKRQFNADLTQSDFIINQIQFDQITLKSLDLTWNNIGHHQAKLITGTIFDQSLTQTYAFMSMDPEVLSDNRLVFALDDVPLLLASSLVGLIGASGTQDNNLSFAADAGLYAGYLYWPNKDRASTDNADLFISANGSLLIQFLLEQVLTQESP